MRPFVAGALAVVAVVALLLSGSGCKGCRQGAEEATVPGAPDVPEAPKEDQARGGLADSVYARQIPLYPGAVFGRVIKESNADDPDAPDDVTTRAWHFKVPDPEDQVIAFYQTRLSGASKEEADGETIFTVVPPGAKDGEVVAVSVLPHELTITEVVVAKPEGEPAAQVSPASGG